ncbi:MULTISPECIES: hypothetical protein [Protofrankia]|uniref:hypothetical protein n=1 Tax=Protofrankia TaxID=2994361 RepID=UPI000B25213D|nr:MULTISPECIES: hypothetical protein [Protofrankia]
MVTTVPVDVRHAVVTAEKVREKLSPGRGVVLLEVHRDTPTGVTGRIPNARVVSLATQLAGPRSEDSGAICTAAG